MIHSSLLLPPTQGIKLFKGHHGVGRGCSGWHCSAAETLAACSRERGTGGSGSHAAGNAAGYGSSAGSHAIRLGSGNLPQSCGWTRRLSRDSAGACPGDRVRLSAGRDHRRSNRTGDWLSYGTGTSGCGVLGFDALNTHVLLKIRRRIIFSRRGTLSSAPLFCAPASAGPFGREADLFSPPARTQSEDRRCKSRSVVRFVCRDQKNLQIAY